MGQFRVQIMRQSGSDFAANQHLDTVASQMADRGSHADRGQVPRQYTISALTISICSKLLLYQTPILLDSLPFPSPYLPGVTPITRLNMAMKALTLS